MEIKCYILNFDKLENENEILGAWFEPPLEIDDIKEKIGLNDKYKRYGIADIFITNYGWPFDTNEYTSIEEINRLCILAKKIEGTPIEFEIRGVQNKFFNSFQEMAEHVDDIKCYSDYHDMMELAYCLINEQEIPDCNYETYARELELSGKYLVTAHGIFEYID